MRALVTEDTDRRDVESEQTTFDAVETDPSRTEHTQEVAVGETRDVTAGFGGTRDHLVRTTGDVFDRLAPGRAVREDRPVRNLLADVDRRAALVVAVVPLGEVVADLDAVAEAGERARVERPLPSGSRAPT